MTISNSFELGNTQAEYDKSVLKEAFFASATYQKICNPEDTNCFLVGRTGSGKSAILQRLEEDKPDHVVRINPEELALPFISNIENLATSQIQDDSRLNLFWITLWKHVLLTSIIKHRYNRPDMRISFIDSLKEIISRNKYPHAARKYVEDYENIFWEDTETLVRAFTEMNGNALDAGSDFEIAKFKLRAGANKSYSLETKTEEKPKIAKLINGELLQQLHIISKIIGNQILDKQHFTYVVIDDLDSQWTNELLHTPLIKALFEAVRTLQTKDNMKFLVALRTDIFERLDYSSGSGQMEKYQSLILDMNWNKSDLELLMDKRVKVASKSYGMQSTVLKDLLPFENNIKDEDAVSYIFNHTLYRPRDTISFMNESLKFGFNKDRLAWQDIKEGEKAYSRDRLRALRDEWKINYPGIDEVFSKFIGVPSKMTLTEYAGILNETFYLMTEPNTNKWDWLKETTKKTYQSGANWSEMYGPLTSLLYRVSFLGLSEAINSDVIYAAEEEGLTLEKNIYDTYKFICVHPMLHNALDIE